MREIRETILENGLKIITSSNPTSPTASLQLWYKVGSRNERTGISGISHIFEHMMFKGTARHPKGDLDRIVQENGMSYNAFTSHDYTGFYEVMAADRLDIAMELESDRMQGLTLDPEDFESEMSVIREERRQTREDPPFGLLSESVEATVFTAHPYHWPIIGWMTDLETITLDDLKEYYGDYYRPNNAALVVAGDVEHDQVVRLADRYFGPIDRGPDLPSVKIREPAQFGERTVSVRKPVQLPGIIVAFRAPANADRDAKVVNLIEFVLLHGRSSRLYQSLIYREQLATGLSGGIYLRKDPSTFSIQTTARPGIEIEKVRDVLYDQLDALKREPLPADELDKALKSIESDYIFGQESNTEMAHNLGAAECRGSWKDFERFFEDHRTITPHDVQRVASEIFAESGRTVGYLVPEEANGKGETE